MNINGRYNICHLNATEFENDWAENGTLEMVEWDQGESVMIQIISPDGDLSTAIVVDKKNFFKAFDIEDPELEWIGSSGGVNFYGPKEPPTPSEDEPGFFKCDRCGEDVAVGEEVRLNEAGPIFCSDMCLEIYKDKKSL